VQFSKRVKDKTLIQFDKRRYPELITARNDYLINPHNQLQLQGWRANVDFKPVLTTYAALQYISKYASKAESRSLAFSEILDRALQNSNPDNLSIMAFQKLLLHTISEQAPIGGEEYDDNEESHVGKT
ncbi:29021_t:CDS:2, partial [Racocetra persica]